MVALAEKLTDLESSAAAARRDLLYLVHRIPYPPNKGDKIRSFNLLRFLATRYRVHLGAFVDVEEDWQYATALREWCHDVHLEALRPGPSKLRSLTGLATREALSLPYYRRASMQRWVRSKVRNAGIRDAVVFSSTMASYLMGPEYARVHRLLDMVDVDSAKWSAYATHKPWPVSWLYQREGQRLLEFERKVSSEFDHTVLVTAAEAALFRALAPECAAKVSHFDNGVDAAHFSPEQIFESPYAPGERVLVFTGAMDYWANVDAVVWFAREVMPQIAYAVPEARFYIVGGRPAPEVCALGSLPNVVVTGRVPEIRSYLAHAIAAVAPLRIARGVQNKVLEAMAMAKPVVATPAAMEGIGCGQEFSELVAEDPKALARIAVAVLRGERGSHLGRLGRDYVVRCHDWSRTVEPLDQLLQRGARN